MDKSEILSRVLGVFNDSSFVTKENEQLLSDSWKKSSMDYVIYTEKENDLIRKPQTNELFTTTEKILSPFAVIIKTSSSVQESVNLTYAKRIIARVLRDSAFWFGIVIDKEIHMYYLPEDNTSEFIWSKMTLQSFSDQVQHFMKKKLDVSEFRTAFQAALQSIKPTSNRDRIIIDVIQSMIPTIPLAQYGRTVTTYLDIQFKMISDILKQIGIKPSTEFCRYTSSTSLHRILENKKESMCGLAVMNDKSEGFYLDKCISPSTSYNIWTRPQYEIDEYNNAFITSLCNINKSDDLTMWRLYGGNDGDGVCLVYDIDLDLIRKSNQLLLMPIQYGKRNNPIIQLFRLVAKIPFVMRFQFVLSYKNIFRYFVKPEGFDIEEEYRLLLIKDNNPQYKFSASKWIFNSSYSIFHPIQELNLTSKYAQEILSPLKLKKIILGPKSKESKVNKVQLRSWLNQLGLSNIKVEESEIDFYR